LIEKMDDVKLGEFAAKVKDQSADAVKAAFVELVGELNAVGVKYFN